jgi:predicted dehydrogenase
MTTRVCIVGAGFWATEMHIPALQRIAGVEVRHVVAATEDSARSAAERFGIARWSTDIASAVAADDIDLVDIVAPPFVHADAAKQAAAAGKDAICIKPLGRSSAEAKSMLEAADQAGTRLFYAENVPFIPAVQEAKRLVDAGHIGDVFRVKAAEGIGEPHSDWFFDPELSGGGAVIDMAVHSIQFCRFFHSGRVASVTAEVGTFAWSDRTSAEDTAVITLRFDDGVIGQCEDSWSLAGGMDSRFEIIGTQGRILIDNLYRQPLQVLSASGSVLAPSGWTYPSPIPGLVADGHLAMLEHFVDAHRSGEASRSEGRIGLEVLEIAEAALTAAHTGSRQRVASSVVGGASAARAEGVSA